jgi:hypothetical protein
MVTVQIADAYTQPNGTYSRTYLVGRMRVTIEQQGDPAMLTGWFASYDATGMLPNDLVGRLVRTEDYQPGVVGEAFVGQIEHLPIHEHSALPPRYHSRMTLRGVGEPPDLIWPRED